MMTRTTNADLDGLVERLNGLTDNRFRFSVERAYGKPRLYAHGGSKEVSPRLPAGQLYDWIHAYLAGFILGAEINQTHTANA